MVPGIGLKNTNLVPGSRCYGDSAVEAKLPARDDDFIYPVGGAFSRRTSAASGVVADGNLISSRGVIGAGIVR